MATQANAVPFLNMFPFFTGDSLEPFVSGAEVIDAAVEKAARKMRLNVRFSEPVPPVYMNRISLKIAEIFGLADVSIRPFYAASPAAAAAEKPSAPQSKQLFGKPSKQKPTPIGEVSLESSRVLVNGEVFFADSREISRKKGQAASDSGHSAKVLSFYLSDGTGSIHVSKFFSEAEDSDFVDGIQPGKVLSVYGSVSISRYDSDLVIEPISIAEGEKAVRQDKAEGEKRVELHLHTQMSAMDALTDTKAAIKRAIAWGHRAIAITDHGVAQSFPDAMKAAGDKIKVLYGVEGYYVNDMDDHLAVYGSDAGSLSDEIVCFDIETTGLNSLKDRITEIGAVVMKNGEELERFQTFVDPGMPIPDSVVQLTGIRNSDVEGAPSQEEAVRAFLEFAGDRPLAAHNAAFDVGFIYEVATQYGIPFEPRYVDTMSLSQGLLPDMKNHKLDTIAARFGLPEFAHHRASDDAVTCGRILARFAKMLEDKGVTEIRDVQGTIQPLRWAANQKKRYKLQHIILLAKTQTGIRNLYKLITKSHLEYFRHNPVMPKSVISELREGLIIGAACEAGEVFSLIRDHRSRLEQQRLGSFYDYLEIQPICNNMFMLMGEHPTAGSEEDLRDYNRRVIQLGDELGLPVAATGDVHFLDPEDETFRHVLLTAKEFDDADKSLPIYFKTTDEMLEEFAYLGKEKAREVVIEVPNRIADMCEDVRPLPPAVLYPPKIANSAEDLKSLVYGRMEELYGANPPEMIVERLNTEMDAILGRGYDVIYMSAQKLVADSLAHGYLVGSRGSVGSSLVAYMSGITEVNSLPPHYRCPKCKHTDFDSPAKLGAGCGADLPDAVCPECGTPYKKEGFDIPFETFLGFGGDKVPDIDLNFSGEYQANAHKYTNELFGSDHVFRAGTIGTVAEKTAFGYVRKYAERTGKVFSKAEETRLALGCVGVKRTTGQHPGGLVVIPQDKEIYDFCPAQHPADDSDGGIITTHFEYHCMEANLLKLDELGHDDPTMLRMLEDLTGVNVREIPLDDPATKLIFKTANGIGLEPDDIIGQTGTIGIPEFGTGFTRQMLVDTQPETFDTLVRLSGYSHGTDVWLGNAKDLIASGTATVKDTIGCRDDIMLYLISVGMNDRRAFKIMESVRKGRGLPEGAEDEMKALGVPDWYIDSCRKIKYLFPKAHAVAYVTMGFRIAWFKVHYPLAFYSAYFYRRSQKDNFDAELMTGGIETVQAKIREIRANPAATTKEEDLLVTLEACYEFYKRGFSFTGIDLNLSDAVKFNIVGEDRLCPPFVAISGLGETAAYDLAEHCRGQSFISVEDLAASCSKVSRSHIESLRRLGALGDLPETSQLSLF